MRTKRSWLLGPGIACVAALTAGPVRAEVTRFEVLSVERNAMEGRSFGNVGTYELIKARVTVAVDPADRRNAVIADINLAPRNASGKVEAVSDVEILRPSDPKRGNGKLFYEVVNRGNKQSPNVFNEALTKALATAADAGNGYLMRQGYTLVWSGWQGDLQSAAGTLALAVPTLTGVTGRITAEMVFDNLKNPAMGALAWPAARPDTAKLVVRARWDDPAASPEDMSFHFVDPLHVEIQRPAGFDGGAIYSLEYEARDPKVLGLGFAATRDIVAYLRRDTSADNPLAKGGACRSGMCMPSGSLKQVGFCASSSIWDSTRISSIRWCSTGCWCRSVALALRPPTYDSDCPNELRVILRTPGRLPTGSRSHMSRPPIHSQVCGMDC